MAVLLAAVSVLAQSKPNFAGKWTLVPDPNAAAPAGGRGGGRGGFGGLGQTFTATQDDKTLTVVSTNQMGETKAVYNLDGSASKNPLTFSNNTIDRESKVKWDGAKLVITTTTNFNGNAIESTQSWSLDASGSLIVESTSNFQGTPTSTKLTYKKG
jgi:hypothetical protein